ncbi:MAG TPA: hemolysin family protein [Pyrinomonadaceae bacterium]|jgi:CBS domain containing-hemolysin-like protein
MDTARRAANFPAAADCRKIKAIMLVPNIFVILLLVFLNGFFVAAEFAFVSVRRAGVEAGAQAGDRRARRLLAVLSDLNAYLSAAQLGITLASLALGWLGEPAVARLLEGPLAGRVSATALHVISLFVAFAVITTLHIVLGEQAPKLLGLERAERVALASAAPMQLFYKIFRLPVRALDAASARTVRLFGLTGRDAHGGGYTQAEVQQIVAASERGGHIETKERQMIDRVFAFGDAQVRAAMIPRTRVHALPASSTLEEAREAFRATGYSRLPVYRERLDDAVGVLFRKDLDMGQVAPDEFDPAKLARSPAFIPASATLGSALAQMQARRVHFAFVSDEYGGVEGILTLEDLLEEIVGEIDDEYDEETRAQIAEQPDGTYLLDGMLAVRDANQRFGLALPEGESYTTVAGFLMARAGRVLKAGEAVEHGGARFTVERIEGLSIRRVRLALAAASSGEGAAGGAHATLLALACAPALAALV